MRRRPCLPRLRRRERRCAPAGGLSRRERRLARPRSLARTASRPWLCGPGPPRRVRVDASTLAGSCRLHAPRVSGRPSWASPGIPAEKRHQAATPARRSAPPFSLGPWPNPAPVPSGHVLLALSSSCLIASLPGARAAFLQLSLSRRLGQHYLAASPGRRPRPGLPPASRRKWMDWRCHCRSGTAGHPPYATAPPSAAVGDPSSDDTTPLLPATCRPRAGARIALVRAGLGSDDSGHGSRPSQWLVAADPLISAYTHGGATPRCFDQAKQARADAPPYRRRPRRRQAPPPKTHPRSGANSHVLSYANLSAQMNAVTNVAAPCAIRACFKSLRAVYYSYRQPAIPHWAAMRQALPTTTLCAICT